MSRACRLTSLRSLTLFTSRHNTQLLADLGVLHLHPNLAQLRLIHQQLPRGRSPSLDHTQQLLPHRLTSLCMEGWGGPRAELPVTDMLGGAGRPTVSQCNPSSCGPADGAVGCMLWNLPSRNLRKVLHSEYPLCHMFVGRMLTNATVV